jgi:hypothetical protein
MHIINPVVFQACVLLEEYKYYLELQIIFLLLH